MPDKAQESIGLAEFIQQVKQDLLSVAPGKEKDAPFLFVESVELELQVTVKRTGKAGAKGSIKIEVLGTGGEIGLEAGGDLGRDDVQKVKVKLSPLFDKDYLLKTYKDIHSEQVLPVVNKSIDALFKGDEESNLKTDLVE
jgi:Trypsin-co-occurring domain 2